jgi:hypothetical protein
MTHWNAPTQNEQCFWTVPVAAFSLAPARCIYIGQFDGSETRRLFAADAGGIFEGVRDERSASSGEEARLRPVEAAPA